MRCNIIVEGLHSLAKRSLERAVTHKRYIFGHGELSMLSDAESTLEELKGEVDKFCEERGWTVYHNAKDLVIGVVTEGAELLELMRFKTNEEVEQLFENPQTRSKMCAEIADVLYFLLRLARLYKIDLAHELELKLASNSIKYPAEKFYGSNKKYNEP